MTPEDILPLYERLAADFARARDRTLFERRWLDRALAYAPGRSVLDIGCGPGLPIDAYLADRRCSITGVDGSPAMISLFQQNLPRAKAYEADMRELNIGETYDLIIAWNSLYHLDPGDQRAMFATFAAHAHKRSVLLFTTGPSAGEGVGEVAGAKLYHASLAPADYRTMLAAHGFEELAFVPEDPDCHYHSVWLARFRGLSE